MTHLDGRGIQLQHPRIGQSGPLEPRQILKVSGEGMPIKKSDAKGNLYLEIEVKFPTADWMAKEGMKNSLRELLPKEDLAPSVSAELVDEVSYEQDAKMEDFGEADPDDGQWVDDDEEGAQQAQCAQQ